jgi:hypothetical protein
MPHLSTLDASLYDNAIVREKQRESQFLHPKPGFDFTLFVNRSTMRSPERSAVKNLNPR